MSAHPLKKPTLSGRLFIHRGGPRYPLVYEVSGSKLVTSILPQTIEFQGDAVLTLVEKGHYTKKP